VKEMAELRVELVVLVIRDLQHAVLDPEGVAVVLARGIALDLGRPAVEVLAIEQRGPAILFLGGLLLTAGINHEGNDHKRTQPQAEPPGSRPVYRRGDGHGFLLIGLGRRSGVKEERRTTDTTNDHGSESGR